LKDFPPEKKFNNKPSFIVVAAKIYVGLTFPFLSTTHRNYRFLLTFLNRASKFLFLLLFLVSESRKYKNYC